MTQKRKEIDNYMTVSEAAYRWEVSENTLKQRLKPYRHKKLDELINSGLLKYFKHPERKRREWIISREFMEMYYGEEKK